jgi:hypothetical protein
MQSFYKLMGKLHPKGSFFFDVSSFFAKLAFAANVFEFATLKYHGGAVIGDSHYVFTHDDILPDFILNDIGLKIPGHDFKENVKFFDRKSCPDTCAKNPCTSDCYCAH